MQTMSTISEESRRALQELNSLFGTIGQREDASALASINTPTDYQEEYKAGIPISYPLMESMIDQARQFSVERTLTHKVRGDPRPDLLNQERIAVAYRVVQEALSNVRKHAGLGARVLLLKEREKDLNQGLCAGRILAANKKCERIGASMQAEVAATLDAIIRRTERAKDLLAEARNLGVELDPDRVTQAFEEIGRDRVARLLQDCVNCWSFFITVVRQNPGGRPEGSHPP